MAANTRYKDLLDYSVAYKTVWMIMGVAVAIVVAGWFAWQRFKPPGEDERARQVIKEASRLAARADGCVQDSTPPEFVTKLKTGRSRLGEARTLFEAGRWAEASTKADSAREQLRAFNDAICASLESVARFIEFKGDIKVKTAKSARWVNASRGTRLLPGDRIRVDSGMARIEFKNGEKQLLKKGTLIQIQSFEPRPDGGGRAVTTFERGELVAEGVTNGDSTIATEFGEASPREGDIELKQSDDGRSLEARSLRGGATFQSGDTRRVLGEVSRMQAKKGRGGSVELGEVEADLLGPDLREPIDGRHFVREEPAREKTAFEWRPAESAVRYRFQIARNEWFGPVLNEGDETVPQGSVDIREAAEIKGLPEGTYFWRVAAVDDGGAEGRWSQVYRFTISQGSPVQVDRPPPSLSVDKGLGLGDKFIFKGQCDPYARLQVFVNGKRYGDVDLSDDGSFNTMVPVEHEGENIVTFEAQDTYGTKKSIERPVYWSGF